MTFPSIDTIATYGGVLVDYKTAKIDGTTDRSASEGNKAFGSVAAMSHCAPQLIVQFQTAATTGAIVLVSWEAAWKTNSVTPPTLARSTTGVFTVTLGSTFTDELGDTQTTSLRWAIAQYAESTAYRAQVDRTAANVYTVYTFNAGGTAADNAGADLILIGF